MAFWSVVAKFSAGQGSRIAAIVPAATENRARAVFEEWLRGGEFLHLPRDCSFWFRRASREEIRVFSDYLRQTPDAPPDIDAELRGGRALNRAFAFYRVLWRDGLPQIGYNGPGAP